MIELQTKEQRCKFTQQLALDGIIMLKNDDNVLPIGNEKVAIFGRISIDTIFSGGGSAYCTSEYAINIVDGMKNNGICIDEVLEEKYREWCKNNQHVRYNCNVIGPHHMTEMIITDDDVKGTIERGCKKAFFVIGRYSSETEDCKPSVSDYYLTRNEEKVLNKIKKYYDDIIVILNRGNQLDYSFTQDKNIKGLLNIYYPGMEGGDALGKILSGKVSPSGKLTDTIAKSFYDYPSSYGYGQDGGLEQLYKEDIYVGYRYFYTIPKANTHVLYPFGFGLSYANFTHKIKSINIDKEKINVTVEIKNVSKTYPGKDVAMIYTSSPKSKLDKEKYVLRAFDKTKELKPGETQELKFTIFKKDLTSFDDTGITGYKDSYVLESGTYKVYEGNDVSKIKEIGKFYNKRTKQVKKCVHIDSPLKKRLNSNGDYVSLDYKNYPDSNYIINVFDKDYLTSKELSSLFNTSIIKKDELVSTKLNVSSDGIYSLSCGNFDIFNYFRVFIQTKEIFSTNDLFVFKSGNEFNKLSLKAKNDFSFNDNYFVLSFSRHSNVHTIESDKLNVIEGGMYTYFGEYVVSAPFVDPDGLIKCGNSVNRFHKPGRYVEYEIDVKKSGIYALSLRYSNETRGDTTHRRLNFYVNGERQFVNKVKLEQTNKPNTQTVFKTSQPVYIKLEKGINTLSILEKEERVFIISYITLERTSKRYVREYRYDGDSYYESNEKYTYPQARPLNPIKSKLDARNVKNGTISLKTFIDSLSVQELAHLTCSNDKDWIGYLPDKGLGELIWSDGPNGLRQKPNTNVLYPSPVLVASSWNRENAYLMGKSVANDCHEYKVNMWLGPAMNIHRNPLCGRNFEYFSEDPYLASEIASQLVLGAQDNNVTIDLKHFAANNTEFKRLQSNSIVSARALREIYFKGFEYVINKVDPNGIMTSYNLINYEKVPENKTIIIDVIRNEFGYQNLLTTDWANNSDLVKELQAGHDIKMILGNENDVIKAYNDGILSLDRLREAAYNVAKVIIQYQ